MRKSAGTEWDRPAFAAGTTWLVAFALLVQTLLAGPLAVQMMGGADASFAEFPLCVSHQEDGGSEGAPLPASPSRHDHDHCVICQGAVASLGLAELWRPPVPAWAAEPPDGASPNLPPAKRPPPAYASRAPPLNA